MPELLRCVEIEPEVPAERAVIWMHGLGASGHDFEPVVPHLGLAEAPGVRFVFPHAPAIPVTVNGGMVMRAWFDIDFQDNLPICDRGGVDRAHQHINALIEREHQRGISSEQIVIAGFSQGGAMALHIGLRHPERLAGIMALSTALPFPEVVETERHEANLKTSIFLAHGAHDAVIEARHGVATRDLLAAIGHDVRWREYPMAHEVCGPELEDIGSWLSSALAP